MTADAFPQVRFRRGSPLGAVAVFLCGTLFLAAAVHICAILLVPMFATSDGWSRLAERAGADRFVEIPVGQAGQKNVAGLDPLFVNGACRLQLGDNPAALAFEARDRFWSLALYDRRGTIIFSLNDRTAVEGRLDMIVVTPEQNAALRRAGSSETDQRIVVESRSEDLIALLRLFAPTVSARAEGQGILNQAECLPEPLEAEPSASG